MSAAIEIFWHFGFMEAEWDRIKDLRRRVGLEANEQPPRKREWFNVTRQRIEALWPSGHLHAANLAPMKIAGRFITPLLPTT